MNLALASLLLVLPQTDAPDLKATLEPALEDVVERFRLPGLAIGVVRDGEVVYARGFGEAVRGSGTPITTRSIFHMASVSKPFVATAAMQLVEDGKLELDAPLTRYLPYFRLAEDASLEITVRQVLMHRSGFPDVRDYEWDKPQFDEGAAERYVRSLKDEHLVFAPGTSSQYSNMAFDTMGDVIAKVSGVSFDDFVKARILAPLGMASSSFIHSETPSDHRTQGHSTYRSPRLDQAPCPIYPYNRRHAPSSTLNSNVDDMCRWMLANLERGELDGARILRAESYDELWTGTTQGLSWVLGDFGGRRFVNHSGGDVGFNSYCALLHDDGIGVSVMINSDASPVGAIARAALSAALGESFSLPTPRLSSEFAAVLEAEGMEAAIERVFEITEGEPDAWRLGVAELDQICAGLLDRERNAEAVEVAAINADLFPAEGATFARLGTAMLAAGDAAGARDNFEHALRLSPNDEMAREGLRSLSD